MRSIRVVPVLLAVAALTSGCGSGPATSAAVSVRCSGPTLAVADSGPGVYSDNPATPQSLPVRGVRGAPVAAGSTHAALPSQLDPGDQRYGYVASGWRLSRVSASTGVPVWSTVIPVPVQVRDAAPSPIMYLYTHPGYVTVTIAAIELRNDYIAAVDSTGRAGPVCALPQFATNGQVELLPHAGVVVLLNKGQQTDKPEDHGVDAYQAVTGKRLWSVPSGPSAGGGFGFTTRGDTAYVWRDTPASCCVDHGDVAAYNVRTGKQLWDFDPGSVQPASLSTSDELMSIGGRVYALVQEQDVNSTPELLALGAAGGKLLWRKELPQASGTNGDQISLAAVGTGQIVVVDTPLDTGHYPNNVYLLQAATGNTLAKASLASSDEPLVQVCQPGGNLAVAIAQDGQIQVISADGRLDRAFAIPAGSKDTRVSVQITGTVAYVRVNQQGAPVRGYGLFTGRLAWTVQVPHSAGDAELLAFDGGFAVSRTAPRAQLPLFDLFK